MPKKYLGYVTMKVSDNQERQKTGLLFYFLTQNLPCPSRDLELSIKVINHSNVSLKTLFQIPSQYSTIIKISFYYKIFPNN